MNKHIVKDMHSLILLTTLVSHILIKKVLKSEIYSILHLCLYNVLFPFASFAFFNTGCIFKNGHSHFVFMLLFISLSLHLSVSFFPFLSLSLSLFLCLSFWTLAS